MNQKNSPQIEEVLQEKDSEKQKEKYNEYVSNITPKSNRFLNCAKAFLVGGTICLLGEGFNSFYQYLGNDKELAGLYTTLSLILLSIILTGLNIYQKLGSLAEPEVSFRLRDLPIRWYPRRLNSRQRDRSSALAARFLQLPDR